jgi:hypothetical protein
LDYWQRATITVAGDGGGTWQAPLELGQSATLAGVTTLRYTEQDAVLDVTLVIHGGDVLLNATSVNNVRGNHS